MQALARGVQGYGNFVFVNGHADDRPCAALRKGFSTRTDFVGKALDNCLFCNPARYLDSGKRTLYAFTVHKDFAVDGQPIFPRDRVNTFKQLVKGRRLEFIQDDKHSFAAAQ